MESLCEDGEYVDFGNTDDVDTENPDWDQLAEGIEATNDDDDDSKDEMSTDKDDDTIVHTRKSYLGRSKVDSDGHVWVPVSGEMKRVSLWHLNWNKRVGKDSKIEGWPGKSPCSNGKYICTHDTYEFDGPPWPIVREYSSRNQQWYVFWGTFCSPQCAMSFLGSDSQFFSRVNSSLALSNTRDFWKKFFGLERMVVNTAPPKYWLKRWQPESGIDIKEWRAKCEQGEVTRIMPKNVISEIEMVEITKFKRETKEQTQKRMDREQGRASKFRKKAIEAGTAQPIKRRNTNSIANQKPTGLMRFLKGKQKST